MFSESRGTQAANANGSKEQQETAHLQSHAPSSPPPTSSSFVTRLEIFASRVPQIYVAPFCGASAGVASGFVTCPLDVIKTKLQAQGGFARRSGHVPETKNLYRGMLGTGRTIWREDGIRGLYQGLGPMIFGYLPTWAVYLAIYDRSRDFFFEKTGRSQPSAKGT